MLVNMFTGNPPGNTDRILDFSTAVTGCLFFVPPAGFLDDLPDPPGPPGPAEPPGSSGSADPAGEPDSGSLGIGSLKRSNQS
jgi:putative iron-dependent peroxidase